MDSNVRIQAEFDFVFDQFQENNHLEDVRYNVGKNFKDYLKIGIKPTLLARMMWPMDVMRNLDWFEGIDINPIASRLKPNHLEEYFDVLVDKGLKAKSIQHIVPHWDSNTIIKHSDRLLKIGFSRDTLAYLLLEKFHQILDDLETTDKYLDIVVGSRYLYSFLAMEDAKYGYGDLPFSISLLVEHGGDKGTIGEYIAEKLPTHIFDEDMQRELQRYDIRMDEETICQAVTEELWIVESLIESSNPYFAEFARNSSKMRTYLEEYIDDSYVIEKFVCEL